MKQFVIEIEYYRYLVQVNDEIADNLETLYSDFNAWLCDKDNDHGYWVAIGGDPNDPTDSRFGVPCDPNGRDGVGFDENAFIKWLNENHGAQAEVVATEKTDILSNEFFDWSKIKGYVTGELAPGALYFDLDHYPDFIKETDCLPEIQRLVERQGVKRVYF
ncbi:hypothetical protein FACS1894202_01780 [Clostridia bacterium]|nr:hypothetical protein FACS1894202_01780 [Clostridia bacterium]